MKLAEDIAKSRESDGRPAGRLCLFRVEFSRAYAWLTMKQFRAVGKRAAEEEEEEEAEEEESDVEEERKGGRKGRGKEKKDGRVAAGLPAGNGLRGVAAAGRRKERVPFPIGKGIFASHPKRQLPCFISVMISHQAAMSLHSYNLPLICIVCITINCGTFFVIPVPVTGNSSRLSVSLNSTFRLVLRLIS